MRLAAATLVAFGLGSTALAQGSPPCSAPTPGTVVHCPGQAMPGSTSAFPWAQGASPYPATALAARDVHVDAGEELVVYGFVLNGSPSGEGTSVQIERMEGGRRVPYRTVRMEAVAVLARPEGGSPR
jgi:hypothetical protein